MLDPSKLYPSFKTVKLKKGNYYPNSKSFSSKNKYLNYINSKKWRNKANLLKCRYKRCYVYKSTNNLHAHHKIYKNLGKEKSGDIIILCKNCHKDVHNLILNDKQTKLKNAHIIYKKLCELQL